MLGRITNLRRAAALSLRALSSAEAVCSSLVAPESCSAGNSFTDHATQSAPSARLGWCPPVPYASRPFSSLEQALPEPRQAPYYVEVITGDVRGAGSPAPASITLYGEGEEISSVQNVFYFYPSATHPTFF